MWYVFEEGKINICGGVCYDSIIPSKIVLSKKMLLPPYSYWKGKVLIAVRESREYILHPAAKQEGSFLKIHRLTKACRIAIRSSSMTESRQLKNIKRRKQIILFLIMGLQNIVLPVFEFITAG